MARVNVPVTLITRAGVAGATEVNGDATNNHVVINDSNTWVEARNAHATLPQTVTVLTARTVDGQAVTNRVVSVPALSSRRIGPFSIEDFGSSLQVNVSTSDIKLTAFKLPD